MSRKPDIRWRESDIKELDRIVRNFNRKINYQMKHHPEIKDILPEKLHAKELKEKIETRQDFNREMKSIKRFSKKGAEQPKENKQGLKITEWEYKETALKVKQINIRKAKEYETAKTDATKKGIMGSLKENTLKPKKMNFEKMNSKEWEKFAESVENQIMSNYTSDRARKYKENYLKNIVSHLGETGKDLFNLVSKIDAQILYDNYYEDAVVQIQFTSDPLDVETITDSAYSRWTEILLDKYSLEFNPYDTNEDLYNEYLSKV